MTPLMTEYSKIEEYQLNSDTIFFGILTKIHDHIPFDTMIVLRDYRTQIIRMKHLRELIDQQLYE